MENHIQAGPSQSLFSAALPALNELICSDDRQASRTFHHLLEFVGKLPSSRQAEKCAYCFPMCPMLRNKCRHSVPLH